MGNLSKKAVGWIGGAMLVMAYFLFTKGTISNASLSYQALNVFGSFSLAISAFYTKNWPTVCLQVFWIAITIWGAL